MPYLLLLLSCLLFCACQSAEEQFIDLVEKGDAKKLRTLLESGHKAIAYKDKEGRPLSFLALERGHYEVLVLLLKNREQKSSLLGDSINILGFAIQQNNEKACTLICQSGIDFQQPCYRQTPPLHYAVQKNRQKLIDILLKAGALVNYPDTLGNTAIFYTQSEEAYKSLRQASAKTTVLNKAEESIKTYSKKTNNAVLLKILAQKKLISFKDCQPTALRRSEISFSAALTQISKRKRMPLSEVPLGMSDEQFAAQHNYRIPFTSDSTQLIAGHYNHFLYALELAYYEHRPILISPDMIWLLLCQGFSTHINQNPERYRHLLVNFSGKKDLSLQIGTYTPQSGIFWKNVLRGFSDKANSESKDSLLLGLMSANFSTSSAIEELVFRANYLDVMKNYFDYILITCGIPSITIEGTPEDWEEIAQRVEHFRQYDLDWWVDELKPCLAQFVRASKGDVDYTFWQGILKNVPILSCDRNERICTGWINNFFPYIYTADSNQSKIERNTSKKLTFNRALSGIALVPFRLDDEHGNTLERLEFCAGFIGIEQAADLTLRPKIGYGIISLGRQ